MVSVPGGKKSRSEDRSFRLAITCALFVAWSLGAGTWAFPEDIHEPSITLPTTSPTLRMSPDQMLDGSPQGLDLLCGPCDQLLELTLVTDAYGFETSWELSSGGRVEDCSHSTSASGNGYDSDTVYTSIISEKICANQVYIFTIHDDFGDGMYPGGFTLMLEGNTVATSDGVFEFTEIFQFIAPVKTQMPTSRPSLVPSSLPTYVPATGTALAC